MACDTLWITQPCPRQPRLQVPILWRPEIARCRISSRNRLGVAYRTIHRCMAPGLSGRLRRRAPVPRWVFSASWGSLHRLCQRNLRRRTAVHSAWMRSAGVECRRSFEVLGENVEMLGITITLRVTPESSYGLPSPDLVLPTDTRGGFSGLRRKFPLLPFGYARRWR